MNKVDFPEIATQLMQILERHWFDILAADPSLIEEELSYLYVVADVIKNGNPGTSFRDYLMVKGAYDLYRPVYSTNNKHTVMIETPTGEIAKYAI